MGLITVTISCPINTCVLFLNKRTNTKLPKLPSSSTSYDNTVTIDALADVLSYYNHRQNERTQIESYH